MKVPDLNALIDQAETESPDYVSPETQQLWETLERIDAAREAGIYGGSKAHLPGRYQDNLVYAPVDVAQSYPKAGGSGETPVMTSGGYSGYVRVLQPKSLKAPELEAPNLLRSGGKIWNGDSWVVDKGRYRA